MRKTLSKINVLFVVHQLGAGGSERIVLDLVRHLDKSIFNVYVACLSGGELLDPMSEASRQVFRLHKKNGLDASTMLQISRIIKTRQIDVVNPHHYMPFIYSYPGAKVLHDRMLIFTEHAESELEYPKKHKMLCQFLFHRTNAIVGVSKEITESFRKKFPSYKKKMLTILNAVDIERFVIPVNRDEVRASLGIFPSDFVIGVVANFRKVKNHACLIKAFHQLSAYFNTIRLVLVGKGSPDDRINCEDEIRHLVDALGLGDRVVFTGYRSDIPTILKSFDLLCLPSFSEGLPVSVLEAMASRVPVVGSDVAGIHEVISHEHTGMLFPSNDPKALADIFGRLIRNPNLCEGLRESAFDYVSQTHGMKQWIDAYQGLFQRSIHRDRRI